ncbi:MAG: TrpR-like protein, YerC/YecD [Clostridia bacterium]|nr:TrpR-like protein, YerC/YecD [Clostridia bacterium]
MNDKLRNANLNYLFKAILSLENMDDCCDFFEDLCTASELCEMSKRLEVAKLLRQNVIYNDIAERTGLSTATISRVNRCLKYGTDGYLRVLDRLDALEENEKKD